MTGLVYSAMMLFMGLAAINSQANLLFAVFGLMIGVLLVSGVISRLVLRKLAITRLLPDHGVVGQRTTFQYEFTNRKRFWPSLSACVSEIDGTSAFTRQPVAYLLHAAARMTAHVPVEVVPQRRGLHQLGRYQLSTSFPFGFIKRAADRRLHDTFLIYPAIARVEPRLLEKCLSAEHSGARMRPQRGGSDEFYGVREYRGGENPRLINWRRSARTGVMVSNEMTRIAPPRIMLFLDTFLTARTPAEHAAVERTIAMAASLVEHAQSSSLSIGILLWSDGWQSINPSRGKRHVRDLMSLIAQAVVNTSHDTSQLLAEAPRLLRSGTTGLLLTPRDVEIPLSDVHRGNFVVICAASEQADRGFHFPDPVDFAHAMPAEQEPEATR